MTATLEAREAGKRAAESLAALADRYIRAAQSLTRIVMRLATLDDPQKAVTSMAKYAHSGLPEPDAVADIAAVLEGSKSAEWRETRAKQRRAALRHRLEWQLSNAELPIEDLPDWGQAMVLRVAREKSDILAAAVQAIEHDRDGSGEILHHLTNYMAGRYGVFSLRHALEKAGVAPGQSNVIPLPVHRGRA